MTLTVKHASLTGAAANPDVLVDGPKWDADHTVTGLENVPNIDATNADNITGGSQTGTGAMVRATALAASGGIVTAATTTSRTAASSDLSKIVNRSNAGGSPNNNMQDTLPGSGSVLPAGFYTFKNVDASGILAIIVGSGANLDGSSTKYIVLGPADVAIILSDSSNYYTIAAPGRAKIAKSTTATLQIQSTGSDNNPGVLSTLPKATRQAAYDEFYQRYDLNEARIVVQQTGNISDAGVILRGRAPGLGNNSATTPYAHAVHFIGDTTTPSNCTITSSGDCFQFINGASAHIDGFKLISTAGSAVNVAYGAVVGIGHIEYGVCALYHIKVGFGPGVHFDNSYTVSGGALSHMLVYSRGSIENQGGAITCTMSGTPSFPSGVFASQSGGIIAANGLTISGNVNAASPAYALGPFGGDILVGGTGTDLNTLVPNAAAGTFTGNSGCVNGLNAAATFTALSATTTLGYATGAGGTVTQATSKATGVTLNKASGQITMNNAALASAAVVSFTLTNSLIAATDTVTVNLRSGNATPATYRVHAEAPAAGSCIIVVTNISGGPLSEALVLNFNVIKGVTS